MKCGLYFLGGPLLHAVSSMWTTRLADMDLGKTFPCIVDSPFSVYFFTSLQLFGCEYPFHFQLQDVLRS